MNILWRSRRKDAVIKMLDKLYKVFFSKISNMETSLHEMIIIICSRTIEHSAQPLHSSGFFIFHLFYLSNTCRARMRNVHRRSKLRKICQNVRVSAKNDFPSFPAFFCACVPWISSNTQATSNVHQQFHSRKSTLITCVTSLIDLKNSPSSLIGQPRRKQSDDL